MRIVESTDCWQVRLEMKCPEVVVSSHQPCRRRRTDQDGLGDTKQDLTSKLRKIIKDVAADTAKQENDQLGLPGMGSTK